MGDFRNFGHLSRLRRTSLPVHRPFGSEKFRPPYDTARRTVRRRRRAKSRGVSKWRKIRCTAFLYSAFVRSARYGRLGGEPNVNLYTAACHSRRIVRACNGLYRCGYRPTFLFETTTTSDARGRPRIFARPSGSNVDAENAVENGRTYEHGRSYVHRRTCPADKPVSGSVGRRLSPALVVSSYSRTDRPGQPRVYRLECSGETVGGRAVRRPIIAAGATIGYAFREQ